MIFHCLGWPCSVISWPYPITCPVSLVQQPGGNFAVHFLPFQFRTAIRCGYLEGQTPSSDTPYLSIFRRCGFIIGQRGRKQPHHQRWSFVDLLQGATIHCMYNSPGPRWDSLNGELIRWMSDEQNIFSKSRKCCLFLHVAQTTYFLDFESQSQDLGIGQLREHVPNQNLRYLAKPVYQVVTMAESPPKFSQISETGCILICLVVYLPLWKMMDLVSWDDDIPNWMEIHTIPWFQTTKLQIISIHSIYTISIIYFWGTTSSKPPTSQWFLACAAFGLHFGQVFLDVLHQLLHRLGQGVHRKNPWWSCKGTLMGIYDIYIYMNVYIYINTSTL